MHTLPNGTEPLIFLDFENGAYTADGEAVAVTALLDENSIWGTWSVAHISAGVGLVGANGGDQSSPVFTGAALALVAGGSTILIDFAGTDSVLGFFLTDNFDEPVMNYFSDTGVDGGSISAPQIGDGFNSVGEDMIDPGNHKVALTMIDGKIARSTDGNAVISIDPALEWDPVPQFMGMTVRAGITVRSIGLYPAQPDADLPGLSAL